MKQFDWTDLFSKRNIAFTQLFFWLLVPVLFIVFKEYPQSFTGASLVCILMQQTLELAIPCYSQNYLVLPLFKKEKWFSGIALYLFQVVLLIYLLPYVLNLVGLFFENFFQIENRIDWTQEHIAFSVIAFTIVATLFKLALDKLLLDKEQKETELKQLKAQLNPHFLFNTLNNLYGLSVTESKKLPELMLKLSDLLRYSLYDTNQNYVSLEKELNYITNYVELEKIRLDEKTCIEFEVKGDPSNLTIAPLMLIVFIENGFKHYSFRRGEQGYVHIRFALQDSTLHLNIRNSLDETLFAEKKNVRSGGGIGLGNARKRLNLIYPQNHHLVVNHKPEFYEADLKINLSRT